MIENFHESISCLASVRLANTCCDFIGHVIKGAGQQVPNHMMSLTSRNVYIPLKTVRFHVPFIIGLGHSKANDQQALQRIPKRRMPVSKLSIALGTKPIVPPAFGPLLILPRAVD